MCIRDSDEWVSRGGKDKKLGSGSWALCTHFGYKNRKVFENIEKWIVENGDPRLNDEWVQFKRDNS